MVHRFWRGDETFVRELILIQNYGLFWQREHVEWGWKGKGNQGRLLGRYAAKRKAAEVDFGNQWGVYVLYDDNFRIIYVGQAGGANNQRLFVRLKQHKNDPLAQRWSRFSWFGIVPVERGALKENGPQAQQPITAVLDHIEAILIGAAEPPLNLQRGRFGQKVEQSIQFIEDTADEDEDE